MKGDGSKKDATVDGIEVWIPMHLDNWALSLASGYIGPGLKADRATDVQSPYSKSLLAFISSVPQNALTVGDEGPRVVLRSRLRPEEVLMSGGNCFVPGLLRVTRIESVHFTSDDDLKNFNASYGIFPDVPTALLPRVVGQYEISPLEEQWPIEASDIRVSPDRRILDYFGGWVGGLIEVLAGMRFDKEIQAHLGIAQNEENTPFTVACSLLKAFHPDSSTDDEIIWGTVVEVISEKGELRGFDRANLLDEVAARALRRVVGDASGVHSWVDTCAKIIRATIDPPVLDDRKRIGQRAALGALLAPDYRAASSLNTTLEAGPRVHTLVMVVARAFEGLSRLSARHKSQVSQLEGILEISAALQHGRDVPVRVSPRQFDGSGRVVDQVIIGGRNLLVRELPATPYETAVLRSTSTSGFEFHFREEDGMPYIRIEGEPELVVWLQEETPDANGTLNVRLVVSLGTVSCKITTKQMRPYLEAAWSTGCSIGIRKIGERDEICAFTTIPFSDFNQKSASGHLRRFRRVLETTASSLVKVKVQRAFRSRKADPKASDKTKGVEPPPQRGQTQ